MSDFADRIRRRLEAVGKSAAQASREATGNPTLLSKIMNGGHSPRIDTLRRLATVLECDLGYLTGTEDEVGAPPAIMPVTFLRVRHIVQAGWWREMDDVQDWPEPPVPMLALPGVALDAQWAERVEGDSMDLVYPPGCYLYVVDPEVLGWRPRTGDRVIVERTRDGGHLVERTVKEVELVRDGLRLWPRSRNPRWSEPIDYRDDVGCEVRICGVVRGAFIPEGPA